MFKQILRNATKPCLRHQQRVYYSKKAANKIEYQIQPKIDFNHLCENATDVSKNMLVRNYDKVDMEEFCQLNQQRLSLYNQSKELRNKRNEITSYVGKKRKDDEKHASLLAEGKQVKHQIKALEEELKEIEEQLLTQGLLIPNETHPDSPIGPEENARVIKVVGEPRQNEEGNLQDHLSIATQLDILDLEQAAITTGSSFYYLQGMGAFLELALVQYAMQKAAQKGFFGVITPDIVRTGIAYGCGFQPRSGEHSQIYDVSTKLITDNDDSIQLCLAGTAEIPLAGKFATKLFNEEELPKRVVGFGHAFRTEAGGRGVTTKGLYRVHQFSKVELFAVTLPEQSEEMMEEIKNLQEEIFTELGLCFRILDMPTEELGASAFRKYDMEAWMPGRGTWGEISSTSNCTDYQSRRLSIRYRPKYQQQFDHHTLFCHTLNGTAIAVPRIIISILETFQKPDGSVEIPAVLRKWLPGEPSHLFPAAPSTSSKSSSKASSKTSSKKEYQKGLMKSPLY